MRPISPHFRTALLSDVFRFTFAGSKIKTASSRAYFSARPHRLCAQFSPSFDDDMGKEDKASKNFNLKVPKGTRDCTFLQRFSETFANFYQGLAKMPHSATACSKR